MQQSKVKNVSELLISKTTMNVTAKRCGGLMKAVYNVKAKVSMSQSLKHRKGAGRPMKMSKNNKISITVHPR